MFDTKLFIERQLKENKELIKFSEIDQSTIDLQDYIKINEFDSKKSNLNINYIYNNIRFIQVINRLLFEIYKNNLGLNEDKSKEGILDIHPLNNKTRWSILNYFAGHRFVKNTILSLFIELHKPVKHDVTDFYIWVIANSKSLFGDGEVLNELVNCNMTTYRKGSKTELLLIETLESLGYGVEYFCPGSTYDRDHGIDIIVTFKDGRKVSFQVKELTGISANLTNHIFFTPNPKDYRNVSVNKILLLNLTTLEYVSFPNDNYIVDGPKKAYMVKKDSPIKFGNIKDL